MKEELVEENKLQKHFFSTYLNMRYGMAIIAVAFPPLLYIIGRFYGIEWQTSMSHYYIAHPDMDENVFPVRKWFVGILFALSSLFYLYKGFSDKENIALNLAAVFALGVAIFPLGEPGQWITIHGVCAVSLFACMVFVSRRTCTEETLKYLEDEILKVKFRRKYMWAGIGMILFPAIAYLLNMFLDESKFIFLVEALGIFVFAYYWWTKSDEMSVSGAEKWALQGRIGV